MVEEWLDISLSNICMEHSLSHGGGKECTPMSSPTVAAALNVPLLQAQEEFSSHLFNQYQCRSHFKLLELT